MSIVVDFAWTKPTVAQLKGWGAVAVGGYVSNDPSKNLSAELCREYAQAGIKSFVFFENTANRATAGYAAGVSDARWAVAEVQGYGMPSWAPVIVAVDFDVEDYAPNSSDPKLKLGPVGEYLRGWCDTLGKGRVGVYGGFWAVTRAIAAGLATYAIQTIAWSGGQVDLQHVACLQNGVMLGGGQADVEVITSASALNLIAWTPGEPNPSAPPKPQPGPVPTVAWAQWSSSETLQLGSTGQAVKVLQSALANSGIYGVRGITVDGDFGNQTWTATGNFQAHAGITEDHLAGSETHGALQALNDL